MEMLSGIRPKTWWEDFWKDPLCDYGNPNEILLKFAKDFYPILERENAKPKAVDIGSGNGRYAIPLAEIGYSTDAIELTASGVDRITKAMGRRKVTANAIQGDFTNLWQLQKNYDLALSSGLLEEIDPAHHKNIIQGYKNWVREGGYIIIKYCLELQGRDNLIEDQSVPSFFGASEWNMIYMNEEKEMRPSRAKFVKENGIDSAIRTGTLVAQKL